MTDAPTIPGTPRPPRRVYTTLDGLRGVAALLVVLYHNQLLARGAWPAHGWLAVDLFFMLSGVVIDRAYRDRLAGRMTVGRFMLVRLIRLWPIYLLGCGAGILFLLSLHVGRGDVPLGAIALALPNLAFVPALGRVDIGYLVPLNPPGWSLVFELGANLGYALLLPFLSRRRLAAVVGAAALGLALLVWSGRPIEGGAMLGEWLPGTLRVSFAFFAGVLISRVMGDASRRVSDLWPWLLLLLVAAALFFPSGAWAQWLLVVALFPAVVFLAARFELAARWADAVFRLMGRLSYPVYVLQYPLGIVVLTLPKLMGPGAAFAVGWGLIALFLVGCALVERFYDRPVRDWLSRKAMARGWLTLSPDARADESTRPL